MRTSIVAVLWALLLVGCFSPAEKSETPSRTPSASEVQSTPPVVQPDVKSVDAPATADAKKPVVKPVPELKLLTYSSTWKDEGAIKLNMLVFPFEPSVGSSVTVFPLNGLATLNVKITAVEKQVFDEINETVWNVSLTPITNAEYLAAPAGPDRRPEFPFDALVLYPEVSSVKMLSKDQYTQEQLPPGEFKHNVQAAIDLNEDGQIDGLYSSFYCKCPEIVPGPNACDECDCDYGCSESYLMRDGKWVVVNAVGPM